MKKRLKMVGRTQQDLADALGKDRTVITRILNGQQPVALNQIKNIASMLEMTEAEFLHNLGLNIDTLEQTTTDLNDHIPMLGMASCGLKGWGNAEKLDKMAARPPGLSDPDAFAVIASGDSMVPEGIRPGYLCICSPNTDIAEGDAVFIERNDDTYALKRYVGQKTKGQNKWIVIQGYLSPDYSGAQEVYTEEVAADSITRMAPVIYIRRKP